MKTNQEAFLSIELGQDLSFNHYKQKGNRGKRHQRKSRKLIKMHNLLVFPNYILTWGKLPVSSTRMFCKHRLTEGLFL